MTWEHCIKKEDSKKVVIEDILNRLTKRTISNSKAVELLEELFEEK